MHRALWPLLALAVATGFVLALVLRPPPQPPQSPPVAESQQP
jgi:hypothetical protein